MTLPPTVLSTWEAPKPDDVGKTVEEFLDRLGGPTWLTLPGSDRSRCRAISTLLHGNEPSGIRALFRWIRSGKQPRFDLVCFVGAVEAAQAQPGFAHRSLPGHQDLNRCFRETFSGPQGRVAAELLARLREAKPEALIDIHNTSGRSPSYGVTTLSGRSQTVLTSLFAQHLILTDIRLGTLMEATEFDFPTVTVECGGAGNPESDEVAWNGLTVFAQVRSLEDLETDVSHMTVWKHPIRVELADGADVASGEEVVPDADVTLHPDGDQYNFGVVKPGDVLGWLGPRGLAALRARDATGKDQTSAIFYEKAGRLFVSRPVHVLMMTTNMEIAKSDCLFYCIPADDQG